ncbi:MAG: mercuric transporter MerT family protein [Gemmatimonadota bacterium]|jgi:mercuric ion transport protein|nr:mercuric transporter MerT family protein [Gemmatimonadota bacterium]
MRKTVLAGFAGLVAAIFGSLCCIGPILFVTFGIGAGLGSTFEPLRPLFTAVMVLGLGFGLYTVYGRRAEDCGPGQACERPRDRRRDQIVLWSATVLAVLFWSFNYWSILLV